MHASCATAAHAPAALLRDSGREGGRRRRFWRAGTDDAGEPLSRLLSRDAPRADPQQRPTRRVTARLARVKQCSAVFVALHMASRADACTRAAHAAAACP
jgi:hypothetical protein